MKDEEVGEHKAKEEDVMYPRNLYHQSTLHNPASTPMAVDSFESNSNLNRVLSYQNFPSYHY